MKSAATIADDDATASHIPCCHRTVSESKSHFFFLFSFFNRFNSNPNLNATNSKIFHYIFHLNNPHKIRDEYSWIAVRNTNLFSGFLKHHPHFDRVNKKEREWKKKNSFRKIYLPSNGLNTEDIIKRWICAFPSSCSLNARFVREMCTWQRKIKMHLWNVRLREWEMMYYVFSVDFSTIHSKSEHCIDYSQKVD